MRQAQARAGEGGWGREQIVLVSETGSTLSAIIARVNEVSGLVIDIAAAAQEQSTALSEVNTAVNQMDQVTQQNAAMVEQTSAASASLTKEADALAGLLVQFKLGAPEAIPFRRSA